MPRFPSSGPLSGRTAELSSLLTVLGISGDLIRQGGHVVLLGGDAGVGNTRIAAEVMAQAHHQGYRVLLGHCSYSPDPVSYLPLREALGRLDVTDPARAAELVARWPALGVLLPGGPTVEPMRSGVEPRQPADVIEAVWCALDALSRSDPTVLVIEDVQWADGSTRAVLTEVFRRTPYSPLSVLITYRLDAVSGKHALRHELSRWSSLPGVSGLIIRPLQPADALSLARALLPIADEEVVQGIALRSEGNPFYVEQLAAASGDGETALPGTLVDLLGSRLERLTTPARSIIESLAVGGPAAGRALLQETTGADAAELDAALEQAVDHFIVTVDDRATPRFRHALLADAVYARMESKQRTALHRAYTAAWNRRTAAGQPGGAAEVARHARAAGDRRTAIAAGIRAGREADASSGPAEALQHYVNVLEILADGDDLLSGLRGDVVLAATSSAIAAGETQRAWDLLTSVIPGLPAGVDDERRARLLLARAQVALVLDSNLDEALGATTHALRLVPPAPPSALRARVLAAHASACFARGRTEEGSVAADQAMDMGRGLGLADVLADVSATIAGRTDQLTGEAAEAALRQAISRAQMAGEFDAELRARQQLGHHLAELGRLADAEHAYSESMSRARVTGRPWCPHGVDGRMMAAQMAYHRGGWNDALALVDTSGEHPPASARALLDATSLLVHAGRGNRAGVEIFQTVRTAWHRDVVAAITSGAAAIDLFGDAGDIDRARAVHDELITELTGHWGGSVFAARIRLGVLLIGQLAADVPLEPRERRRRIDEAAALLEAAETAAGVSRQGIETKAWIARVRAEQLRLLHRAGEPADPAELVTAWQATVVAFTAYGHVFELARSRVRLAAALSAVGPIAEAGEELDAAEATAGPLQAGPLLSELRAVAGPLPARPQDPDQLTTREREVLALVAQGRSNGDIGRELFISGKTVSVHVSNILAKLHARTRTEAAFIARRRGLLPPVAR